MKALRRTEAFVRKTTSSRYMARFSPTYTASTPLAGPLDPGSELRMATCVIEFHLRASEKA